MILTTEERLAKLERKFKAIERDTADNNLSISALIHITSDRLRLKLAEYIKTKKEAFITTNKY